MYYKLRSWMHCYIQPPIKLHPVTRRVWRSAIKISMNKFLKKCLQLGWARDHLNIFSMSRNWINLHRKNNRLDKFKDVQYSTKFVSAWVSFVRPLKLLLSRSHATIKCRISRKARRLSSKLVEICRVVSF